MRARVLDPSPPQRRPMVPRSACGRAVLALMALALFAVGCSGDQGSTPTTTAETTTEPAPPVAFLALAEEGPEWLAALDADGAVIETFAAPPSDAPPRTVTLSVDVCPGGQRWIERWNDRLILRDRSTLRPVEEIRFESAGIAASGPVSCLDSRGDSWVRGDESIYNLIESVQYRLGVPGATGARSGSISGAWTEAVGTSQFLYGATKGSGLAGSGGAGSPHLERIELRSDATPAVVDLAPSGSAGLVSVSGLIASPDRSSLAAITESTGTGASSVAIVDAATGDVRHRIELAAVPDQLGFDRGGDVEVLLSDSVVRFDPTSGTQVGEAAPAVPGQTALAVHGPDQREALIIDGGIQLSGVGEGSGSDLGLRPFGPDVDVRALLAVGR